MNGDDNDQLLVPAPSAWFDDDALPNTAAQSPLDSFIDNITSNRCDNSSKKTNQPPQGAASCIIRPRMQLTQQLQLARMGAPHPAPSWKEISLELLPLAAQELLLSSLQKIYYKARVSYSKSAWVHHNNHRELNNNARGYYSTTHNDNDALSTDTLPLFSSLPWIDRQLVQEWRTYGPNMNDNDKHEHLTIHEDINAQEDFEFDRARALVPTPARRPIWQNATVCFACCKPFGPTRLRHHCRLCGNSFCQKDSANEHALPHLGYSAHAPERTCDACHYYLRERDLAERVAWRLARCRDCASCQLVPYFETGTDSVDQIVRRVARAAIAMARSIPLGCGATVAVETVDVLRRYGLNGIYTILLRQEFLAAADLLQKALGINHTAWPLSVHELSAAIFYALAQYRAMRGIHPDREHLIHSFKQKQASVADPSANTTNDNAATALVDIDGGADESLSYNHDSARISSLVSEMNQTANPSPRVDPPLTDPLPLRPVCDPVSDDAIASMIFYAPMALSFIYATKEVDMQLLAAQQGWRLLYAYMDQGLGQKDSERPASALFVHEERKIACVAIRGTATIHDVITDIRQIPVPFPDEPDSEAAKKSDHDWTTVFHGQGLAVCGMAGAALNLYREHIDSILYFARKGYRIRLTGHSLGGGVATLLGALAYRDLEQEMQAAKDNSLLKVYAYGTPSCVDAKLACSVEPFVTTVVLHDDVIPRLTPTSCRGLLKHLLHIRETWVKDHLQDDLMAIKERAKTAWAPTFRNSFTLAKVSKSSSTIKRYCRRKLQNGKRTLLIVKDRLVRDMDEQRALGCVVRDEGAATQTRVVEKPTDDFEVASDRPEKDVLYPELNDRKKDAFTEGSNVGSDEEEPHMLVDFMGGLDSRYPGIVIDGDEFFDPDENLTVDSDSDDESDKLLRDLDEEHLLAPGMADAKQSPVVMLGDHLPCGTLAAEREEDELGDDDGMSDDSPNAVILEETPLPRMYIPGKIVHIYSHRGIYKAAYVPRTFRELRRISMAGNMLSDHKAKPYYEALLELRSVREAPENPPVWTAFDEDDTWYVIA
jgi:hypothetical protein